jgi:hypothetical protein
LLFGEDLPMRRNQVFWGLVAIISGITLLLQSLGIIQAAFWPIFWPLLLILAGVWFLLGPSLFRSGGKVEQLDIPIEGATLAEIHLKHGAGRLEIQALELPGKLLSGTFGGGVERELNRSGSQVKLKLKSAHEVFYFPGPMGIDKLDWNVGLARDLPLQLKLSTGASESEINLTDLQVTDLRLETGASSTHLTLPAHAGYTQAHLEAGAASLQVSVPQNTAANISFEGGLAEFDVDKQRFPAFGGGYRSPDFDTAANRVALVIKVGVGSVSIR